MLSPRTKVGGHREIDFMYNTYMRRKILVKIAQKGVEHTDTLINKQEKTLEKIMNLV